MLLLRHGRTAWNAERRFQGQLDPPLDDVGRAQAYEVAPLVAASHPELIVTSDSARAVQTAAVIAEAAGLTARAEPRLRERGLGHWEGLTREEVAARYPDEYADWVAGRDVSRRGGETRGAVAGRALEAFRELPEVPVAVVVTHSATAMALTNALLGIDQEVHPLGPLANCHWTELYLEASLDAHPPAWRLRAHNLGPPGTVLPVPVRLPGEDASDADA